MSRIKKVDANQAAIVQTFRQLGATVEDLHGVGGGFPDLLIGFMGENVLVEVKEEKRELQDNQKEWGQLWRGGPVIVVHNEDEALALIRRISAGMKFIGRAIKKYQETN
jgi:hypothetical protein